MKRVLFVLIIILSLGLLFYGSKIILTNNQDENFLTSSISNLIPVKIKSFMKNTIFFIPSSIKILEENKKLILAQEHQIKNLKEYKTNYVHLIENLVQNNNDFSITSSLNKKIQSNFHQYNIKIFPLPLLDYESWGEKPTAYIDQTNDYIIIVSGDSQFFYFSKNEIELNQINLKSIKSNIKDIVKDEKFYKKTRISIKDIFIKDNSIFLSFTKLQKKDCYNTSILKADFNNNFLFFENFFTYNECLKVGNRVNVHGSGGRMVLYKENTILLTIGEYNNLSSAQDKNSMFGKVIAIDLTKGDYYFVSMGHRNPQGLYYEKDKDVIIITEHGPKGGDEININKNVKSDVALPNFGWPISSYGYHYDGKFRENAPLHKSHEEYGFIEPIKHFTPSIGISEVIKIPKSFNEKFTNDFFVSSLGIHRRYSEGENDGTRRIHHIRFDKNFNNIIFEDVLYIGSRIRDLQYIKKYNQVILSLESIPGLAVLRYVP